MEINSKKIEKEKRIKKEIQKLKKIYKSTNKNKNDRMQELIYRASFLLILSQDMESELIECESFTTTTINATQTFTKSNPLLKDYRDTVKSYQSVIKQLEDLNKDDNLSPEKLPPDELDLFLSR